MAPPRRGSGDRRVGERREDSELAVPYRPSDDRRKHVPKRALRTKGLEVVFDPRDHMDYISGFRKRKQERRREALAKLERQAKAQLQEERAERRAANKEEIRRLLEKHGVAEVKLDEDEQGEAEDGSGEESGAESGDESAEEGGEEGARSLEAIGKGPKTYDDGQRRSVVTVMAIESESEEEQEEEGDDKDEGEGDGEDADEGAAAGSRSLSNSSKARAASSSAFSRGASPSSRGRGRAGDRGRGGASLTPEGGVRKLSKASLNAMRRTKEKLEGKRSSTRHGGGGGGRGGGRGGGGRGGSRGGGGGGKKGGGKKGKGR